MLGRISQVADTSGRLREHRRVIWPAAANVRNFQSRLHRQNENALSFFNLFRDRGLIASLCEAICSSALSFSR